MTNFEGVNNNLVMQYVILLKEEYVLGEKKKYL